VTKQVDGQSLAPSFSDAYKRLVLGKPMINDELEHERLSNPVALGVLSPDAISSTAVFPILVFGLMRLNHQYRAEASVLETSRIESSDLDRYDRHRVFVFVDSVDLAEVGAMRYGKGLHADELVAVHFVLDSAHAERLQRRWQHFRHTTELRLVECLDRNLARAAQELVFQVIQDHPDTKVTVLFPRRTYSALLGRLLHDRTADKIAAVVSRIPGASAQIVAYDIESRIKMTQARPAGDPSAQPNVAEKCIDVPESHPVYAK
jgi:hypothetical protein